MSVFFFREVLKEDESGSLKATVEELLFQSKRKRCVRQNTHSIAIQLIAGQIYANYPKGYCCYNASVLFYMIG